jgi:hypothetical protein
MKNINFITTGLLKLLEANEKFLDIIAKTPVGSSISIRINKDTIPLREKQSALILCIVLEVLTEEKERLDNEVQKL